MPKQTARNNQFLAGVKRYMNPKIYHIVSTSLNHDGPEMALAKLRKYFRNPEKVDMAFFERFTG